MHTRPMADSQGEFTNERPSSRPCVKCGAFKVVFQLWESECGGYEDIKYTCKACDHVWWVDGSDS